MKKVKWTDRLTNAEVRNETSKLLIEIRRRKEDGSGIFQEMNMCQKSLRGKNRKKTTLRKRKLWWWMTPIEKKLRKNEKKS